MCLENGFLTTWQGKLFTFQEPWVPKEHGIDFNEWGKYSSRIIWNDKPLKKEIADRLSIIKLMSNDHEVVHQPIQKHKLMDVALEKGRDGEEVRILVEDIDMEMVKVMVVDWVAAMAEALTRLVRPLIISTSAFLWRTHKVESE